MFLPIRWRPLDRLGFRMHKFIHKTAFSGRRAVFCVFLCCALVFASCASILVIRLFVLPRQSDAGMDAARSLYRDSAVPSGPQPTQPGNSSSAQPQKEAGPLPFSELQAVNKDVTGWVTISGTAIDYPVLCAPANSPDYYLTHDWEKSTTKYGSIYLLHSNLSASRRKNTILYGHSMADGRMFASLLQYDNLAYYRDHPIIQYQQGTTKSDWKIFAVIKTNTDPAQGQPFDYQKTSFTSTDDFLNYLYQVRIRSVLSLPVNLKSSDDILTLSTCSYEFDGFRTVVFARRVRSGESAEVSVAKAGKSTTTLYPDCWYQRFGGKVPSLPTFQEARSNQKISWLE